ncbi:MAG: tetratricopeptide repeat protein [Pseudomonadota bacterium]
MEIERKGVWGVRGITIGLFLFSFVVRLIHNGYVMESPLYFFPLGGHVPYMTMAEKIAQGNLIPIDRPFSLSSPLFPYILALEYALTGINNLFASRLIGIFLDSVTCLMVAMLTRRHFGRWAGIISGLGVAAYGPMIFYSAEVMAVPYTLFFVTLAMLLLDRDGNPWIYLLSSLFLGIAVGTRPNLMILAIMTIPLPFLLRRRKRGLKSMAIIIGLMLTLFPITLINHMASGKWVFLTTSGGHNFFFGHNPHSTAGYTLPLSLDGDLFLNMKGLAERVEGRPFEDDEVSPYYFKKGLHHVIKHPLREIRLMGEKALAAINDYEASTYVNYYLQRELSPVLAYAVSFKFLFPLAALGLILHFRKYTLLMPVMAAFLSILIYFYISRLRMPMIPFLAVFAGGALTRCFSYIKRRQWSSVALIVLFCLATYTISNLRLVKIDTSNEWNKMGVVFRAKKQYVDAEKAFFRAMKENPSNPNTYFNLSVLYRVMGDPEKARRMRIMGDGLRRWSGTEGWIRALKEG